MKPSEILLGLMRIPLDFLMGLLAFFLAYQVRTASRPIPGIELPVDLTSFPSLQEYQTFSFISVGILLLLFAINGAYGLKNTKKVGREMVQVAAIASTWLGFIIVYFFIIRAFPFSRLVLIYSWLLAIILISSGRIFIRVIEYVLLKNGIGKRKLLFIGDNTITEQLAHLMKKEPKYRITGVIDNSPVNEASLPYLGKINQLETIVKKYHIEEIIQTKSDLSHNEAADILSFCREHHLSYRFVPGLLAVQQTNVEVEDLNGFPIINLKPTPLDGWGKVIKRGFDIFGSLLGIIILSPIFVAIAIAIKLDSKGHILFRYLDDGSKVKRIGERGKAFSFYKFRTMYPNTHNLRYTELAANNIRKGSPLVKIKNDPRITPVGKWLRKTSFDELPQLLNVLKGEMSLVGPRPHLPEEVAKYQKHHKFVLTIKPGITGLAQISGRSDLDFEEEVQLDTSYIENWSIWLDLKILAKTIFIPFRGYKE